MRSESRVPKDLANKLDDTPVVKNSANVESALSKKHSATAHNFTGWQVAAGAVSIAWIKSEENSADAFVKRLVEMKQDYLFGDWTHQ